MIQIERPKISIYIAASIDRYIARKDNSLDWMDRVGGYDEDYGFKKVLDSIDALIIGRKTYEVATTVPDPYPGKRVVVLSNSLDAVREGMELYRGDLVESPFSSICSAVLQKFSTILINLIELMKELCVTGSS